MTNTKVSERIAAMKAPELIEAVGRAQAALADGATDANVRQLAEEGAAEIARRGIHNMAVIADRTEIGRRAGSPAANQFGVYQVHEASEAQVRFLQKLIAERDLNHVSPTLGAIKVPATLDGISKKSASALIERLLGAPMRAASPAAPATSGASEKQVAFIKRLAGEKAWEDLAGGVDARNIRDAIDGNPVDRKTASATIDWLLTLARKPKAADKPEVEIAPGAYNVQGRVVRVYHGQQSGKMLCAELVDPNATERSDAWQYLGLASRFIDADARPMTPAECEAVNAGHTDHGWCCVCGRELDDPNSVARGIGPVCYGKQQALAG